jgi:hypothetical protein
VCSVIDSFGQQHDPTEWYFVVESTKYSLEDLLLHKGNKFPSIPHIHSAKMKESYGNMKLLFEKIQYGKCNWNICGDLKVTALLSNF